MKIFGIIKNTGHKILHWKGIPLCIYLLLLAAASVNVSLNGEVFSYVIFYVFLLYLPVSVVFMIVEFFLFSYYQEIPKRIIKKNTAEKYELMIQNSGPIPIGGINFFYNEEMMSFSGDFTKEQFSLAPKEKKELSTELFVNYAGSYDVGIRRFSFSDVFGVISIPFKVKIPVRVSVLPVIRKMDEEDIENINELRKNGTPFSVNMNDDNLGNDIRKYVPGDRIADIHWKNYARTGELYVRVPEKKEINTICMVIITEAIDDTIPMLKQRDRFLEYLVSVADYFAMINKPVVFYYYNSGVKNAVVDDPVSFREFYKDVPDKIGLKTAAGHEQELVSAASESFNNIILFKEDGCMLKRAFED